MTFVRKNCEQYFFCYQHEQSQKSNSSFQPPQLDCFNNSLELHRLLVGPYGPFDVLQISFIVVTKARHTYSYARRLLEGPLGPIEVLKCVL